MNSSRKINYSTRVSKNIERKMIRDLLQRMGVFYPLTQYSYVGFGSKYFTDFLLFHKYLHINKLISIEGDVSNREKYEFNKPLKCIDLRFGMSNDILPELDVDSKCITWLDYDGLLNVDCFKDIATMVSKAGSGSVLFISYNSRPIKVNELESEYPSLSQVERIKAKLKAQIGDSYIPHDIEYRGLSKWRIYSALLRKTILNCINERIAIINQGREFKLEFTQFVNFNYQDGVEMSTLGFVFHDRVIDKEKIEMCKFEEFEFSSFDCEPYEIEVPNLTQKEIKHLMEIMPEENNFCKILSRIVPPSDIKKFSKIYKYLPNFTDAGVI